MISKHFHRTLTGLILLCCINTIYCQQLQFERLTTSNGLLSDHVYSLHMDKKGYIWACTNNGIVKYNGKNFVPVCTNIPFKENLPFCMFENEKNGFWFANSRANVYTIRNDSAFRVKGFEALSIEIYENARDLNNLIIDDSLNIFLSTTTSSSYKLASKEKYAVKNLTDYLLKDSLDFIVLQYDKHSLLIKNPLLWPTDNAFFSYKIIKKDFKSEKRRIEIKNKKIVRLAIQINDSHYITAGNELIQVRADGTTKNILFDQIILSLAADKKGNIWIGLYEKGLYKISPEGDILEHYFAEGTINSIVFDDQSGLWVSTAGQGVFHCKNIDNYAFLNYPGLMKSVGMVKKIDSVLFIGTYAGELFKISRNGIPEKINLKGMTNAMIGDIVSTPKGYYIASKDALLLTDHNFKNVKKIFNKANQPATALAFQFSTKGELFNLGRTSLNKIENNENRNICIIPSKAHCFLRLKNDSFLIGTSKGLFLFTQDSLFIPFYLKDLKDVLITEIKMAANGDIWICTSGYGLFRLGTDNKLFSYPDMPANVIHDIFFLNDTTLGLCLNNGVFVFPHSKIKMPEEWQHLHNEESSNAVEFNHRLYFSTNAGLLSFSMNNLRSRSNVKLYLKHVIAGDSIYSQIPLTFNYEQEKVEFNFELLDYKTNATRLFYSLEGKINETGIIDGTKIVFNKLNPGDYILNVYSANSVVQPNKKGIRIAFTIEPAYWQTTWFIILTIILTILFLVFIIYLINLRTKTKERQKAKVTRLLAEYKLTALKAQINPHFISNSLSAIQQLILDDKADKAAQYLAKFSLLIRYVLKYSDKSMVKLSEELEVIDLNIQLETLRFKDDFEIQKIIDKDVNPENVSVPPLITQPFIENAIWHGLLPLKGKRKPKLTIRISKIDTDILICIEDNGVGRNSQKEIQRESQGTQLISNRLENINLLLGTKTAMLKIEDLYDEKKESAGTRVNIVLPDKLNNSEYDED